MIKNSIINLIKLYQKTPGKWHNNCKYQPSCSNYMLGVINEFGVFKGLILGSLRILRCNPLSKGGYDPIPIRKRK